MPYVTLRYERAKLYEEVWAEAVTTVAKRYGISAVALRKICRQLAVPLPPLGYWAKIAAGRKLPRPPLPRYSGPTEIVRQRYVSDEPVEPDPEHLVARREFEAKPENQIVVSETLDTLHSLVAATERALRRPKTRDARALPATERRALDVAVSEANLPRALRIMDALLKALDARGMPVRIEPDGKRHSYVNSKASSSRSASSKIRRAASASPPRKNAGTKSSTVTFTCRTGTPISRPAC
jgi:hypothetical protein